MYNVLKTEKNSSKNDSLNISTLKTNSSKSYKNNMLFTISTTNNDLLKKKIFKVTSLKYTSKIDTNKSRGLWDKSEHNKFIEALYIYNCDYQKMKNFIKERTYNQIISHGQKFFYDLKDIKMII